MARTKVVNLCSEDLNRKWTVANNYPLSYFKRNIQDNTDCYLDGDLVFSFRKARFKDKKYFDLLENNLVPRLLHSDHRKMAGGTPNKRVTVMSGILGYYDKLTPQMKSMLGGVNQAGRATAFVRHYADRWKSLLPLFQQISKEYKNICPRHYNCQKRAMSNVHKDLMIPRSVFTTITINKNWRTSTHTDKGDFKEGMSCLVILGKHFKGGYLGFPRLGIVVQLEHGDMILMNSHEPHCNTELDLDVNGKGCGVRYSVVCYLRTDLQRFHKKKVIGTETFFVEK